MARVTVEDSLKNVENRFELILLASKRANDLMNNVEAKLDWDNDKPTVVALREIASGAIDIDYLRKAPATGAAEAGQAFGVTEREEGTGDRGNVEEDPDVALIAALYAAGNQNGNGDTNKEPD